jgi:hypothetical protein
MAAETELETTAGEDAELDASQLKEAIHHLSQGENSALHRIHEARDKLDLRDEELNLPAEG